MYAKHMLAIGIALICAISAFMGVQARGEVGGAATAQYGEERPNIVFFITDDLDRTLMGQMRSFEGELKRGSVEFENAYVADPFCCPSRASILLGQYPKNHKIISNSGVYGGAEAFRDKNLERSTIAYALQRSGYTTGLVGKYFNGTTMRIPEGWDRWHGWVGDLHAGSYTVNNNGTADECRPENCHNTDYLADRGVKFIRESSGDDPFFLYMSVNTPHDPDPEFVAPRYRNSFPNLVLPKTPSFAEKDVSDKPMWVQNSQKNFTDNYIQTLNENQRNYARGMLSVQDAYNGLVSELKAQGEYENTIIVFTSDHGKFKGDHGLGVGKRTPYEHDVNVPLYVTGPGVKPHVENRLTSNIDFYATFADYAGLGHDTDGRSLRPLLENTHPGDWRNRIFVEGYSVASENAPTPVPSFTSVVEQNQNFVFYPNVGEREYYDLRRDPFQLVNKASRNVPTSRQTDAKELKRMRAFVNEFRETNGPGETRSVESKPVRR